jgi:hypothetical protein
MNRYVVLTSFGLNMNYVTNKTLKELEMELEDRQFLHCDNAIIRCSTVMAIMPAPAPNDPTKQAATEILQGMPTEGVKAQ